MVLKAALLAECSWRKNYDGALGYSVCFHQDYQEIREQTFGGSNASAVTAMATK